MMPQYEKHVHAPNAVLAIFQTPKAAQDAIAASPLLVDVSTRPAGPESSNEDSQRTFSVSVTRSYYDHESGIEKNPYYGHWDISRSIAHDHLVVQVPVKEHADCSTSTRDVGLNEIHELKKEVGSRKGLMDLWREGLQKEGAMHPRT
jgi:hypothetical protein